MSSMRTLLYILWIVNSLQVVVSDNELTCKEQETEMDISRHLRVLHEGSVRNVDCTGRVTVTKCEGICISNAKPSANSDTGMQRDCKCCREIGQRRKSVILEECYDGTELLPGVKPVTSVLAPNGCSCQRCRN